MTTSEKLAEIMQKNAILNFFIKYYQAPQEGQNDYITGCIQTANAIVPAFIDLIEELTKAANTAHKNTNQ